MKVRIDIPKKVDPYYTAQSEGGLNPCIPRPSGSRLLGGIAAGFSAVWNFALHELKGENENV